MIGKPASRASPEPGVSGPPFGLHASCIWPCSALLCWLLQLFGLNAIAWVGVAAVAILLLYEHLIISPTDLRRLNAAFFTMNGIISMVFFFFVAAALLLPHPAAH